jgi:hypothetical protein
MARSSAVAAVVVAAVVAGSVWWFTSQQARAGAQAPPRTDLGGRRLFPADNFWNQAIDQEPVDPNSDAILATIGKEKGLHPDFGASHNGGPFGIPYVVVAGDTPRVPVKFQYADESDPGPYPIPPDPPIEGGPDAKGDRHILIVDRDAWKLYELFHVTREGEEWHAGSGAIFDLDSNKQRPAGWTSADAAGLAILPGLARYDEVQAGAIRHALRFTVQRSRRAYVPPARHFASTHVDENLPPMGMRVRLRKEFDLTRFPPQARVVLQALKTYGMLLADNGSDWFISGAPDPRWNDDELNTLKRVRGEEFEVVKMGPAVTQ